MRKDVQLTGRERVRLALEHRETDRIPIAMVCSGINEPAYREVDSYLRRARQTGLAEFLEGILDIESVGPEYVGPASGPDEDIWGVVRKAVCYGPASYDEIAHYPLAQAAGIEAVRKHAWPTTALFDYSVIPARAAAIQKKRERCLMIANANPFESAWYMRGFERMLMDFALNPELAHEIMERVTDFHVQHFGKMLEAAEGAVDLAFTADDIAGQNGLLISLEMWEEFIKPCQVRLNRRIHEFGVKVIYHSDGAVMGGVAGLIDAGIDVSRRFNSTRREWIPSG